MRLNQTLRVAKIIMCFRSRSISTISASGAVLSGLGPMGDGGKPSVANCDQFVSHFADKLNLIHYD